MAPGAFVGVVRDDQLGQVFTHDMRSIGVSYDVPAATEGPTTARCMILVTGDAQRTLNTYLGAASGLTPAHIDHELIGSAQVVYLEGYLWDLDDAKAAMVKAMKAARIAGTKVSFTLSDGFCVDRHRPSSSTWSRSTSTSSSPTRTRSSRSTRSTTSTRPSSTCRGHCEIACLTRSEKGSVVVAGDEVHVIDVHPVEQLVDTTGAGDLYAAGFLYGYTHGLDLATSARLASLAAAEVISHVGARPEVNLAELAKGILEG